MRYESGSSCLIHYGIRGQKWGVRRFQNEDGTLTSAGKERYYGFRRDKDVEEEVEKYIGQNQGEISQIVQMSKQLKKVQDERDKAYKEYYSSLEFDKKQKQQIKKVFDSWVGNPPIDDDETIDACNYEIREVIGDEISRTNAPESIQKIDKKYYDLSNQYYSEIDAFTERLMNQYSQTIVYSTRKGIFGIEFVDKQTNGRVFIQNLINQNELMRKFGAVRRNGSYDEFIGMHKYTQHKADKIFNETVDRIANDIGCKWRDKEAQDEFLKY